MQDAHQRFLIIRLSSIGDIVHALPAVSALGRAFPRAEIDWAVETRHACLLEGNPYVRRVIPFDTLSWRKSLLSRPTWVEMGRGIRRLRGQRYEAALDFQGLYKSALMGWLSNAGERIGFAEARLREPAAAFFYTTRISARNVQHVIDLNLALLEPLGVAAPARNAWEFPLPASAADEDFVSRALTASGTKDFVILNPGGGWQSKCWPPENFAELIGLLSSEFDGDFLLSGSPAEEPLIERIIRESGVARARYFPSTLTQFIALAKRSRLLIAGDTGPLHIATAVGTPVVAIFGPTDPARNGPFSPLDKVLWNQGPIDYTRRAVDAGYISGITVEAVATAVHTRLKNLDG